MIKAVIFDFDGVIVESAGIKTDAFRALFNGYPDKIEKIINHHLSNAGVSRYTKFRYIYKNILHKGLTEKEEAALGTKFSQIVLDKVLKAPLVVGTKEFLESGRNRYSLFIASGTPEEELRYIVQYKGLAGYFKEIFGAPKEKTEIINMIVEKYKFARHRVVYVGDAESDRKAAKEAGIVFIERHAFSRKESYENAYSIRDLAGLAEVLEKIGNK